MNHLPHFEYNLNFSSKSKAVTLNSLKFKILMNRFREKFSDDFRPKNVHLPQLGQEFFPKKGFRYVTKNVSTDGETSEGTELN